MQKLFENFRKYLNESDQQNVEAQLANLRERDQAPRNELQNVYFNQVGKGKKFKTWQDALKQYRLDKNIPPEQERVFEILTPELKTIVSFIEKNKLWSKLSDQAWDDLWLVSQHADDDRAFQKQILIKIKQFPHKKQKNHFEYLSDRISCPETGTQKYGTANICQKDK